MGSGNYARIWLEGRRALDCVQGLSTQNLMHHSGHGLTLFLNAQGRVLADAIVQLDHETVQLWVSWDQQDFLYQHLMQYAAFARVKVYQDAGFWFWDHGVMSSVTERSDPLRDQDDEIKRGWFRVCARQRGRYTAHALGWVHYGAVSFQKGCYLGQEIVHRQQFLGIQKTGGYRGWVEGLTPFAAGPRMALYLLEHAQAAEFSHLDRLF